MAKETLRHEQFFGVLRDSGFSLPPNLKILDFGCGAGNLVVEMIEYGYDSYGCDLTFKSGPHVESLKSQQRLQLIDLDTYTLPFENAMFDIVISDQVFEHIQNYDVALREIRRVLKPKGVCLHLFPPRYIPIEPHVHVPLATVIRNEWWLALWAVLGVRCENQKNLPAHVVAKQNREYLVTRTNYLTKKEISNAFSNYFEKVTFSEQFFLKHSRTGYFVYQISLIFPFVSKIYSTFGGRVVLAY